MEGRGKGKEGKERKARGRNKYLVTALVKKNCTVDAFVARITAPVGYASDTFHRRCSLASPSNATVPRLRCLYNLQQHRRPHTSSQPPSQSSINQSQRILSYVRIARPNQKLKCHSLFYVPSHFSFARPTV